MAQNGQKPQGFHAKALNSLPWRYLESFGTTFIALAFSIVLARVLGPGDYGTVAILYVFINLSTIIIQMGFGSALIRKKDADDLDYSSVFWLMAAVCTLLYAVLFLASPGIARFYEIPELKRLLRLAALQLFAAPLFSVQNALIARNYRFRTSSVITLISLLLSGGTATLLACRGWGPASLIVYYTMHLALRCLTYFRLVPWKLRFAISRDRIRGLFSFGSKLLLSSLLEKAYSEIYSLVVGKRFSSVQLGYYTKGQQFPTQLSDAVVTSIQNVVLPAYSEKQDDPEAMRSLLRRTVRTCAFVTFPALAGLAAIAHPLVELFLGTVWLESAPFLQIFCLAMLGKSITDANRQAYNALGRSDLTLKVNCIHFAVILACLCASLSFGIKAVAWGFALGNLLSAVLEIAPSGKIIGYGAKEQLRDCGTAALFSAVMFGCVSLWSLTSLPPFALMAVQMLTGVTVYAGLGELFRPEDYTVLKNLLIFYVKGIRNGRNNKKTGS